MMQAARCRAKARLIMLHINDLTYRIGGRVLFDRATARLPEGHTIGLVGKNGTGKSTLLRLIVGDMPPDDGSIRLRPGARLGHVMQEIDDTRQNLLSAVLAADTERTALLAEAETVTDPHRIGEVHTRLADIGAHDAPARAARILSGLGFSEADQQKPLHEFSGGWRMRVALGAMLFAEPDLLLLDEPTNYLDLEGVMWLEHFLKRYPRTVLIVSHDRDILNQTVDSILHLKDGRLTSYTGGYDAFERTRREQLEQMMAKRAKQEAQRRHMQAFVDRFRAKATKARQAQSRLKALAKLEPIVAISEDQMETMEFPNPQPLSPPLIALEDVSVGYVEGKPILTGLNQRIDMDDRIALLGANGNGKSTFAKLLAGRLDPMEGKRRQSKKLLTSYFAQHQIEDLNPKQSAYEHLAHLMEDHPEARIRARLAQFGLGAGKQDTEAEKLSGGERVRLVFALMSFSAPHLMLLDEPTNHLDVDAREALIHAINGYDGAVILISHDRHLIETCADRLWLVGHGGVTAFDGDLDDYRRYLLAERRSAGQEQKDETPKIDDAKERRRKSAEAREALKPLKREAEKAEAEMAKLTREIGLIDKALGNPELYTEAPEKAARYNQEKALREKALEEAESRWMEAMEKIEAAEALA